MTRVEKVRAVADVAARAASEVAPIDETTVVGLLDAAVRIITALTGLSSADACARLSCAAAKMSEAERGS